MGKPLKVVKYNSQSRVYYQLLMITVLFMSFFGFSLFLSGAFNKVKSADDKLVKEYELTRAYRRLYVDLLNMETGVRGFQITGSQALLEPYTTANAKLTNDLDLAKQKAKEIPGEYQQIEHWEDSIINYASLLDAQVKNKNNYRDAIPSAADLIQQKQSMDMLRDQIGNRINNKLSEIEKTYIENNKLSRNYSIAIIFGNIMFFGLCVGAFMFILRRERALMHAEERIKKSENLYRTVLDAVNDGVFEYDIDTRNIFLSQAHQNALGYDFHASGVDAEQYSHHIHPDDMPKFAEQITAMIAGERNSYQTELRLMRANGEYVWHMSRTFSLRDASDRVTKIVGINVNIDEQKKREIELEHLNAELETFTYVTSHDLRSPLVNLKGFSKELQFSIKDLDKEIEKITDKIDKNHQQQINEIIHKDIGESVNFIISSVDRMDNLTKALLDLARIGRYEIKLEKIDVKQLVETCVDSLGFEIKENNIELSVHDLPIVVSDKVALTQIFGNLIENAIKYRRDDITSKIEISCTTGPSEYRFSIKDNGRGIDDADKGKIFELFRRARNVGQVRGEGLGMAYVRATIRRLGGDIDFTSKVGEGTNFIFTIPKKLITSSSDTTPEAIET
ncbi:ATP-binding protein [Pseudaquidulcibacter saccharophilus]|uniref:ATP-binding protein n=1 Tax=Pseudaquidulcibacter saccharophilus TaxID=2831900 RepID=UPI001EFF3857|nr:ATP-binding protein [Pseudaquidulcibacter saccharophilus]